MRNDEKAEFTKLLAASMAIYERQITSGFVDIFFSALGQYPLAVVREALNRHLQDPEGGRFAPKPADLIRQVVTAKASDGRPGRDEAWAIAQKAVDENETVVVTEEILGALEVARPLIEMRDKVAARMAFVESYDRLVSEKRAAGIPFEWMVSLGDDKSKRSTAIQAAKVAGLLPAPRANALLEMHTEEAVTVDGLAIAGLLVGPKGEKTVDQIRSRLQEIKAGIGKARHGKLIKKKEDLKNAERELEDFAKAKASRSFTQREEDQV